MGMFDFMFGGSSPEMKPTSASQIPEYLQAAGANLVGAAQDVAQCKQQQAVLLKHKLLGT
jgi:hypothetical protein